MISAKSHNISSVYWASTAFCTSCPWFFILCDRTGVVTMHSSSSSLASTLDRPKPKTEHLPRTIIQMQQCKFTSPSNSQRDPKHRQYFALPPPPSPSSQTPTCIAHTRPISVPLVPCLEPQAKAYTHIKLCTQGEHLRDPTTIRRPREQAALFRRHKPRRFIEQQTISTSQPHGVTARKLVETGKG